MKYKFILSIFLLSILAVGCGQDNTDQVDFSDSPEDQEQMSDSGAEEFIVKIDTTNLLSGNSLYYSREDGASVEVIIYVDDSSRIQKMVERYTKNASGSICTNLIYYKNGKKYVTKELFDEGVGESAVFTERVTYYDENEKPKVTKYRKAPFEDQLENESFKLTEKRDCDEKRAMDVLNQIGEFETNFQFFVRDEHLLYLVVGEDKENAYRSSLVVQHKGPVIQKLLSDEKGMIGTPLKVDHQTVVGEMGFEFQALLGVEFVK